MTDSLDIDRVFGTAELESLLDEIRLYLEAVELFRQEGHEPSWREEAREKEVLR